MNRYLIVFVIVSLLAVGSIIVYAKNNMTAPSNEQANTNTLSGFEGPEQPNSAQPTQNMPQVTELIIEDLKTGTGAAVKAGDTVEVNYLGTLLDGRKFDSSYDRNQTFSFTVGAGEVIEGWDQGLLGMQVGGKRKLTIPSDLAYGPNGAGGLIGPNTPLLFEVELVSIKETSE